MMERSDVYTDEFMVDELLGFFGAATETTGNTLQTVLSHLMKDRESLERVRAEFTQVLEEKKTENPTLSSATWNEQLRETVCVDSCFDLAYLQMCINEGLRFQPPGSISPVVFDRDVTLANKLTIKKGDNIRILHWMIHRSPKEWQRPTEFLPDRFNPESSLFLTPSGKKRNSMSFLPWSAGKRICFGKTFAESNMKIMLTYFT